ncbi:MAG: hypothetical protein IPJ34_38480 [Myxococcales bacterium]|nr:hypothetical protein [Myxococcales bacterium]
MKPLHAFLTSAAATMMIVLPCVSLAAWKRTYSYGSQFSVLGYEISFIDDTAMPLKNLTAVTVYVDNRSVAGSYAKVRCCKRDRAGALTPAYGCAGTYKNGATGTGVKTITLTGTELDLCKDVAGTGFPYLDLTTAGGAMPESVYLAGTVTEGS